jgi:type III restriction enzyme
MRSFGGLCLHQLAWEEAMRTRYAAGHFNAAPHGPVDYTNTTDHAGIRIEMEIGDVS